MRMHETPVVTVIYPIYKGAHQIRILLESLRAQTYPQLRAIFIDDGSKDGSADRLRSELERIGNPDTICLMMNRPNQGLAKTYSRGFHAVAQGQDSEVGAIESTPYVLTCHSDVRFGSPDYIAKMVEQMESHSKVAVITGQPMIPTLAQGESISLIEKVNLVTNLMDLFPAETSEPLVSIGFPEGRCDLFRMEAMKAVQFYDAFLRVSGEDQLLAGKLREAGWEICQAPALKYYLSVSNEQDSFFKLAQHQNKFGRTTPSILFRQKGTVNGVLGALAGFNRRKRTLLRLSQMVSFLGYFIALLGWLLGATGWLTVAVIVGIGLMKFAIFHRHIVELKLNFYEMMTLLAIQPFCDYYYTTGFIEGCWHVLRKDKEFVIH